MSFSVDDDPVLRLAALEGWAGNAAVPVGERLGAAMDVITGVRWRLAEAETERDRLADWLHSHRLHPDFEYETTSGQRKAWPYIDEPPVNGEGWELNICSRHADAWERFDFHEERYWRRRLPVADGGEAAT